jgi:hypothetical protein
LQEAVALQVEQDRFEKLAGNALPLGQLRHEHRTAARFFGQRQQRFEAVYFDFLVSTRGFQSDGAGHQPFETVSDQDTVARAGGKQTLSLHA